MHHHHHSLDNCTSRHNVGLHIRRCHRSKIQLHCTEHKTHKSLGDLSGNKDVWGRGNYFDVKSSCRIQEYLWWVDLGLATVALAGCGQGQVESLSADPHLGGCIFSVFSKLSLTPFVLQYYAVNFKSAAPKMSFHFLGPLLGDKGPKNLGIGQPPSPPSGQCSQFFLGTSSHRDR